MTKEEMSHFQHTRPDGKVVNLPRVVLELRVFNPTTSMYESLDRKLTGAPDGRAPELDWFDGVTQYLKTNLHGAPAADVDMLAFYEKELLDSEQFKNQIKQMGENEWVARFKEIKGVLRK